MKLLPLLLVLLSACTGYSKIPNQDAAMNIVWRQVYGAVNDDIPSVQWIGQSDLDCAPDKDGRFHGFYRWRWYDDVSKSDVCVGGVTWEDWGPFCQVALPDGDTFSHTSFAHELYHAFLHYSQGDGNASHSDPGFGIAFGHPYGLVDLANDTLKREGL